MLGVFQCQVKVLLKLFSADTVIFAVDIKFIAFADAFKDNGAAALNIEREFIAAEG